MIRSLLADRAAAPWRFAFDVEKGVTCRSLNPNGWSLALPRSRQLAIAALPPTRTAPARACSLFPAGNLLHERVETRIAAQTIEQRVCLDDKNVVGVTLLIGMFQFLDCALLVAQTCIHQR